MTEKNAPARNLPDLATGLGKGTGGFFDKKKRPCEEPARPSTRAWKRDTLNPPEPPWSPRVCEPGPEPQGTPIGTNQVTIWSFSAFPAPSCAEFRRGSRQGGPAPQSQLFLHHVRPTKNAKMSMLVNSRHPETQARGREVPNRASRQLIRQIQGIWGIRG